MIGHNFNLFLQIVSSDFLLWNMSIEINFTLKKVGWWVLDLIFILNLATT